MADFVTWCRIMRVGPACPKPCDECRLTSRKLAITDIDPADLKERIMAQTTDKPKDCVHVARQAELDAALQREDVCIHVRNDADESVMAWDAERQAQVGAERAEERKQLGLPEL